MPIRETSAKLWFKTKQQQDDYDDRMLADLQLTTEDPDDPNYDVICLRSRTEKFLQFSPAARAEINQLKAKENILWSFGKNDNSIYRTWNIQRQNLCFIGSYLLLRELPIRNFYARSWMLFAWYFKILQERGTVAQNKFMLDDVYFADKEFRNYQAYQDMKSYEMFNNENKIPERHLWKLNQPAYMKEIRDSPVFAIKDIFHINNKKVIAWDGTFSMPLERLAHPLHKDAKRVDFPWWEY